LFTPRGKRFSPRKFLKLATLLIADKKYEEPCRIRTSVGRAYYAAFLYTKAKLQRVGHTFPDDHTVHTAVINALMDRGDTKIGSKLNALKEKRRIADYYMDTPISKGEGNHYVGVSERIINAVELLRPKKKGSY